MLAHSNGDFIPGLSVSVLADSCPVGSFPLTLQANEFPLIWTLPSFMSSGLGLDILCVLIKQCVFWKASPVELSGLPVF